MLSMVLMRNGLLWSSTPVFVISQDVVLFGLFIDQYNRIFSSESALERFARHIEWPVCVRWYLVKR